MSERTFERLQRLMVMVLLAVGSMAHAQSPADPAELVRVLEGGSRKG